MAATAWPFLIGRSRRAGHRVIVAPGFMADNPRDVDNLGWLAAGEDTDPGEALITEVRGLSSGPVTAVFRIFSARERDYFEQGGEGFLKDEGGRPIRLCEGIVLRMRASEVPDLGLTVADMEVAREVAQPFFREFWRVESRYDLKYSASFAAGRGAAKSVPLALRQPGMPAVKPSKPSASAPVVIRERATDDAEMWPQASESEPNKRLSRIVLLSVAIGFVAFIVTFAVSDLVAQKAPSSVTSTTSAPTRSAIPAEVATTRSPTSHAPQAGHVLDSLCAALISGDIQTAYALTSHSFQSKVPVGVFSSGLLPGGKKAQSCTSYLMPNPDTASSSAGVLSITTAGRGAEKWLVGLSPDGTSWQIDILEPAAGRDVFPTTVSSGHIVRSE